MIKDVPPIIFNGLPGSLVEAYLAGITPITRFLIVKGKNRTFLNSIKQQLFDGK